MNAALSLPIIGLYILSLPLVMAAIAFAFEGVRNHRRADLDDPVGFWGYWFLCVRHSKPFGSILKVVVQVISILAGLSLGFGTGGGALWAISGAMSAWIITLIVSAMVSASQLHEQQRADRLQLLDKQVSRTSVLESLRRYVATMRADVKRDNAGQSEPHNEEICVNAGQVLMESIDHGAMAGAKYASLCARVRAAYTGQFADKWRGRKLTPAESAFHHFLSWWGKAESAPINIAKCEVIQYGLDKLLIVLDERIAELNENTDGLTASPRPSHD